MALKKHSDNAVAFTFKRDFETMDHAKVTSTAILGYMVVEYVSDSNLSEPFNRVCDSFESYSKGCSEA